MVEIVRIHESERETMSGEEYLNANGSRSTAAILARTQGKLEDGTLADDVRHNENVVERALEEDDVRYAEIRIPGWFVLEDDRLSEEFDVGHPGATLTVRGLVENYSDGAWRLIAKSTSSMGDEWFNYVWAFVPKSVATVTYAEVEGEEEAWEWSSELRETEKEIRAREEEEWDDMSWDEKLESMEA